MPRVGRMVKESMVKELSTTLSERPNVFVTALNRLPATEANTLRQRLHTSRAQLVVIQRRLGQRAFAQSHLVDFAQLLEGSVGLVLPSEDVLPIAKLIVEFIKSHENQLSLRGAIIDGQLLDRARVEQLASLPPRPMLLAQVVATIESPMADVIFTVERLIGDLAWVAEQAATKKPNSDQGGASGSGDAAPSSGPTTTPAPSGSEHQQTESQGGTSTCLSS